MTINCNDGKFMVEQIEFAWLKQSGKLMDMSSNPMAPPDEGFFAGTIAVLNALIDTMPDGWTASVPPPVVVPPVAVESLADLIDMLEGVADDLGEIIIKLKKV